MPITRRCLRFHLEHQTPPAWSSEIVTHDEAERHLRKLSRTSCGCMVYGTQTKRPKARIYTANGLVTETNIARLMVTMSADRPLQGTDFACHSCADERCANPDHLYIGDHTTNVRDKFQRRRIRERRAARFFDHMLPEIPEHVPTPDPVPVRRWRPKLIAATTCPPTLVMAA